MTPKFKKHRWKPDKDFTYICKRCKVTRVSNGRALYTTPDGKKHYTAPPCIPCSEYAVPTYNAHQLKQIGKIWAAKLLNDTVEHITFNTDRMSAADLETLRAEMRYATFLILRGFDPFQKTLKLSTLDEVIDHVKR